jgi:DNA primase
MDNCAVAACGSGFNKYQLDLLLRTVQPREVILCFDKEDNTDNKYFNKLYQMCSKYKNYCKMSFVFDRENLLQLKDSPVDCGEDTFKKLLQSRVKI